jgi:hypothetical protein
MQRITDPTAVATLPSPPALTGTTGYFGPAVPGISPATRVRYWFVNMIQEELMSILSAASITADTTGTVFNQVLLAIKALIGAVPQTILPDRCHEGFVIAERSRRRTYLSRRNPPPVASPSRAVPVCLGFREAL